MERYVASQDSGLRTQDEVGIGWPYGRGGDEVAKLEWQIHSNTGVRTPLSQPDPLLSR